MGSSTAPEHEDTPRGGATRDAGSSHASRPSPPTSLVVATLTVGVISAALGGWAIFARPPGWLPYASVASSLATLLGGGLVVAGLLRRARKLGRRFDLLREMVEEQPDSAPRAALFEEILINAPAAIILCDLEGRVVYANPYANDLLNRGDPLAGEELQTVLDRYPPELREAFGSPRFVVIAEDAEPQSYHISTRKLLSEEDMYTLHMLRRVTDEVNRQEVEVWKRIIREVQHQLANSLAPIATNIHAAQVLLHKPDGAEKLATILATVAEHTTGLKRFLERYSRVARLPRPDKSQVEWTPFFDRLRHLIDFQQRGELPEGPGYFDQAQIEQVLINLIKNAHESGSAADQVAVAVAPTELGVAIRVVDRGAGMSDEALAQAHLPFYSTKPLGSGVGLALSREILIGHGGQLRLQRRPGGGVVATCWLPDERRPDDAD